MMGSGGLIWIAMMTDCYKYQNMKKQISLFAIDYYCQTYYTSRIELFEISQLFHAIRFSNLYTLPFISQIYDCRPRYFSSRAQISSFWVNLRLCFSRIRAYSQQYQSAPVKLLGRMWVAPKESLGCPLESRLRYEPLVSMVSVTSNLTLVTGISSLLSLGYSQRSCCLSDYNINLRALPLGWEITYAQTFLSSPTRFIDVLQYYKMGFVRFYPFASQHYNFDCRLSPQNQRSQLPSMVWMRPSLKLGLPILRNTLKKGRLIRLKISMVQTMVFKNFRPKHQLPTIPIQPKCPATA